MIDRPTRVIGRRLIAFIIDDVILAAIVFGLFLALTKSYPKHGFKNGIVLGSTRHAFEAGSSNRTWWIVASLVAAFLLLAVLPGLTGWTLGKLATGIRVINREGRWPGILRATGRWIFLWLIPIDALFVWLVGLITMLTTKANQRVGDLVAGTYVVRAGATGRPIGQLVPEVAGFPPGSQPTAAPAAAAAPAGEPGAAPPGGAPGGEQGASSPAAGGPGGEPGQGGPGQPAGWYGDPQGKARLRWWDGSTWTDHTSA